MLSDPINVRLSASSVTSPVATSLTEVEAGHGPGKRVRVAATYSDTAVGETVAGAVITFQRSTTKENKPHGTDRISIRADRALEPASTIGGETGAPSAEFVQVVVGLPKGLGKLAIGGSCGSLRRLVGSILLYGMGGSDSTLTLAEGDAFFARLEAGEL